MINISSLNNPEAGVNQLGAVEEAAPTEEVLVARESGTVEQEAAPEEEAAPAPEAAPEEEAVQVSHEDVKYLLGCLDADKGLNAMFILGILISGTGGAITLTNDIVKESLKNLVGEADNFVGLELQAANVMCEERSTGKTVPGLQLKVVAIKEEAPAHTTGTGVVDAEFEAVKAEVEEANDELAAMRAKAAARAGDNVVPMNSLAKMVLDEATPKE